MYMRRIVLQVNIASFLHHDELISCCRMFCYNQFAVSLARAIELKHAPSLIAALAIETSKLFASADDALKSLEEKLVMKWRKYFQFKSVFYQSYVSISLILKYSQWSK